MPSFLVIKPENHYEILHNGDRAMESLNRLIIEAANTDDAISRSVGDFDPNPEGTIFAIEVVGKFKLHKNAKF